MSEEIKEVHIKTYDEWLKYYKNATKEQVIEDLTQDVKYFADAVKDIKDLQNKLQQKENIIKEVREFAKLRKEMYERQENVVGQEVIISLLNILDKVGDEK